MQKASPVDSSHIVNTLLITSQHFNSNLSAIYLHLLQKLLLIDLTQAQFALLLVEDCLLAVCSHLVHWSCFSFHVIPSLHVHTGALVVAIFTKLISSIKESITDCELHMLPIYLLLT